MAIDGREHAAPTTISAADQGQAVSSCNEAFKDQVLLTAASHAPTVQVVRHAVRPTASRTSTLSVVPLVLRL
jgi:hypothetical protein